MTKLIRKFRRGEEGATMVEYALTLVTIALTCVVAIGLLSGEINGVFERIVVAISGAGA